METVGILLKRAREAKKLTTSEVAETTRIKPLQVEAIERDDFSVIPAVTYGKGFVKLFAQAVDLDPQEMVERYLEQVGEQPAAPVVKKGLSGKPVSTPKRTESKPGPAPEQMQTTTVPAAAPIDAPLPSSPAAESATDDVGVEKTAADRVGFGGADTISVGGLGQSKPSAEELKRKGVLVAGVLLAVTFGVLLGRACRGGGGTNNSDVFDNLPEVDRPAAAEPPYPYWEISGDNN